jgi:diacylglycerol kinase family enzyme
MGTGNRLAHNLSVPLGFREAIQTILTGQSQPLDVGEANGTCFTLMAGAGLDAAIIDSANRSGTKPVLGMLAYAVSAVKKMLFTREVCFTVDTGREQVQRSGVGVMVANAGKLLGGLSLTPGYRTDDGLLDIAILAVHTPLDYVKVVFQGASGRLGSVHTDPGMVHLRAREVTIRSQPSVRVQVDGDVIGITPVTIRLVRQVLIKTKPA